VDNASFAGFNNRSMCRGGSARNIGFKFTLKIADSGDKYWHFSPRIDFGRGGVVMVGGAEVAKNTGGMW